MMVIGEDLSYIEIFVALQETEATLARPINLNLMTPGERAEKLNDRKSFVIRVLDQPKIVIGQKPVGGSACRHSES